MHAVTEKTRNVTSNQLVRNKHFFLSKVRVWWWSLLLKLVITARDKQPAATTTEPKQQPHREKRSLLLLLRYLLTSFSAVLFDSTPQRHHARKFFQRNVKSAAIKKNGTRNCVTIINWAIDSTSRPGETVIIGSRQRWTTDNFSQGKEENSGSALLPLLRFFFNCRAGQVTS